MATVWRVQNSHRQGPYLHCWESWMTIDHNTDDDLGKKKYPGPRNQEEKYFPQFIEAYDTPCDDEAQGYKDSIHFGFEQLGHLYDWFDKDELHKLERFGFYIYKITGIEIAEQSPTQCTFFFLKGGRSKRVRSNK